MDTVDSDVAGPIPGIGCHRVEHRDRVVLHPQDQLAEAAAISGGIEAFAHQLGEAPERKLAATLAHGAPYPL